MSDQATIDVALSGTLGAFSLDVAFSTPMRGVTAIFGPSGSGKTSVLRCIAGLQRLSGVLRVGGELWQDDASGSYRKPHQRPIGYVFQEPSLFSHLSVRNNLLYGARRAAGHRHDDQLGFDDVVDLLGVGHLLDRTTEGLSGGERQRIAMARALLSQPRLLLMDEPLAALDRMAKDEIIPYLESLHESLSIPVFYVSHDIQELGRLADTLVLLDSGRVVSSGPFDALQSNPALPLLQAREAAVMLEARVAGVDQAYALTALSVDGGTLLVAGTWEDAGRLHRVRIAATDVSFARGPRPESTILNCLPARIVSITAYGNDETQVNVVAGLGENGAGARIVARITRKSLETLDLRPGTAVYAQIKSAAIVPPSSVAVRRGRDVPRA